MVTMTPAYPICKDFVCPEGQFIPFPLQRCDSFRGCSTEQCCIIPPTTEGPPCTTQTFPGMAVYQPGHRLYSAKDGSNLQERMLRYVPTWAFPVGGVLAMLSCVSFAVALRKKAK